MKTEVGRFAGDIEAPKLFLSVLTDRSMRTLRGEYADSATARWAISAAVYPELTASDQIDFTDLAQPRRIDTRWLLDRFEDVTGGASPGHPTIKLREVDPNARVEDLIGVSNVAATTRLQKFYQLTKMRPRVLESPDAEPPVSGTFIWEGDTSKMYARARLSDRDPKMRFLLHELGHCCMSLVGFARSATTEIDGSQFSVDVTWSPVTNGLMYEAEDGTWKGAILEEAVAEGLGSLVNRKLDLVKTHSDDRIQQVPDMVAPYITEAGEFCGSAPAAVALELIARELGIPSDRYFRMFVDYANAGVCDVAAREEVAKTIYRGTRGKLTLGQIEELPYPIHLEASFALLWAVEDALEVPDHERYADAFFAALVSRPFSQQGRAARLELKPNL